MKNENITNREQEDHKVGKSSEAKVGSGNSVVFWVQRAFHHHQTSNNKLTLVISSSHSIIVKCRIISLKLSSIHSDHTW